MIHLLLKKDILDNRGYKARNIAIPDSYKVVTGFAPRHMTGGVQPMTHYKLAVSTLASLLKNEKLIKEERQSLVQEFGHSNKHLLFIWVGVDDGSFYFWGCHNKMDYKSQVFLFGHNENGYIPYGCQWIITEDKRRVLIEKRGCHI